MTTTHEPLDFPRRGFRRQPENGLTYHSRCGRYAVYKSDQVGGVQLQPVYWLAILRHRHCEVLLSRHRSRKGAVAACEAHARRAR